MSEYYVSQMEEHEGDEFSIDLTAGPWQIHMDWRWPSEVQEQMDELKRRLAARAANLPLDRSGQPWHDYDYLDYWCNYDEDSELQPYGGISELRAREEVAFAKDVKTWYDDLDDMLYWNIYVDDTDNQYNIKLETGGWHNNQNDSYRLMFTCPHARVNKENLPLVTMVIEDFSGGR